MAFVSAAAVAAPSVIDATRILRDTQVLSSDVYEGRGPATPGETKTVAYLIAHMKAAGLKPAGDLMKSGARAWTQDVPLARSRTTGPIAISVTAGGKTSAWSQGEEIAIRAAQTGINRLTVKDAPVVFIGYGVKAPERNWDDFKGFVADGTMLFDLGQKLANSRVWPEWKDGAEFKATRDATKAMRK